MELINKYLSGAIVPIAIVAFSFYFWMKLKGKPIKNIISVLHNNENRSDDGFKSVMLALAGTLGVGNIVGVASAIALGGAGSVFWMWVSAFLAMILKYCEVLLAVSHRRNRNGENFGGAMYYMKDCFDGIHKKRAGTVFIFIFIVFCLINGFTLGGMIQANAISESIQINSDVKGRSVGLILVILCAAVFLFRGTRIFTVCERLVPFVSILYVIISLAVVFINYERIPSVFLNIINDAFDFGSVSGGIFGFFISKSLRYGTIRGLFSNEAGCGTSPIAHATSKTEDPVKQGVLGIIEVFIDTIVVCTMTAFVILLNEQYIISKDSPIIMIYSSFSGSLGGISDALLCVCICLFAFATIICWGYYGKECVYYYSQKKSAEKLYYVLYILIIYFGAFVKLDRIWELADLAIGVMTVMNLFVLFKMRGEIFQISESHIKKSPQKRALNIKR